MSLFNWGYDNGVKKTGLDKICDLVSAQCDEFCRGYSANNKYGSFAQALEVKCKNVASVFYSNSNRDALTFQPMSYYEALADEIEEDSDKLNRLAACLFGVVLGALYCKTYNQHKDAKDGSDKSINTEAGDLYSEMENDKKIIMKKIKKDISETEVPNKNLVLKMAGNCVAFLKDPMTIELPETIGSSQELGEIAYALVDQKLEGDPFPLVDIFITSSLFRAIAVTG